MLMKNLTIRNVPEEIYATLKKWAAANHRSMQEQVKAILSREVRLVVGNRFGEARAWRDRLSGREWGDIAADIRADRNR